MSNLAMDPVPTLAVTLVLEELENRIQARLCGRVRQFQLILHESGVILRGFARTYHAKQVAQHAVLTESPVPIVANDIEVA